jgi:hypothetical protein
VARRAGTLDPLLAELRAELLHRMAAAPVMPSRDLDRRRVPRVCVDFPARMRVADTVIGGQILDVGVGGVFLQTRLLIEIGERCRLEVDGLTPVTARVAWIRGPSHPLGPGLGLSFELRDARSEQATLELVLAALDGGSRVSD